MEDSCGCYDSDLKNDNSTVCKNRLVTPQDLYVTALMFSVSSLCLTTLVLLLKRRRKRLHNYALMESLCVFAYSLAWSVKSLLYALEYQGNVRGTLVSPIDCVSGNLLFILFHPIIAMLTMLLAVMAIDFFLNIIRSGHEVQFYRRKIKSLVVFIFVTGCVQLMTFLDNVHRADTRMHSSCCTMSFVVSYAYKVAVCSLWSFVHFVCIVLTVISAIQLRRNDKRVMEALPKIQLHQTKDAFCKAGRIMVTALLTCAVEMQTMFLESSGMKTSRLYGVIICTVAIACLCLFQLHEICLTKVYAF